MEWKYSLSCLLMKDRQIKILCFSDGISNTWKPKYSFFYMDYKFFDELTDWVDGLIRTDLPNPETDSR